MGRQPKQASANGIGAGILPFLLAVLLLLHSIASFLS
jgi:hypothetical protein